MNLTEFKTTKDKIRALIQNNQGLKNNDMELTLVFWEIELNKDLRDISALSLLMDINHKKATPQSTILRARRQLNQLEPETRGKSYKGRKENETVITQNINKI